VSQAGYGPVLYAYKLKNNSQLEEEGIGIIFLWNYLSRCSSRLPKIFSLITNVLLQLVRDVINGVCCQRYEKRLEQQKGRPNVNDCAAEENFEEELQLNQYSILSFQFN